MTDHAQEMNGNLTALAESLLARAPEGYERLDLAGAFLATAAKLLIGAIGDVDAVAYLREYADRMENAIREIPAGRVLN